MNTRKTDSVLRNAKKAKSYIVKWREKNPYKRGETAKYNAKFKKDFTAFCKRNKIPAKQRDLFL